MAEAFGLAASVIALLQLAGSCLKLSKKWVGASEFGSSELSILRASLFEFNGALSNFQTCIEVDGTDDARLTSLQHLKPVLAHCEIALTTIKDFTEGAGFVEKNLRGSKFDRKLKAFLRTLDGAKELFVLALHADQRTILVNVENYVDTITAEIRNLHLDINVGLKDLQIGADSAFEYAHKTRAGQLEFEQDMRHAALQVQTVVQRQNSRQNWEDEQRILDWITPIEYATQQRDFSNQRQRGTGQWLLKSPEFNTWVGSEGTTLFCPGIPGSGKTILTSAVVGELQSRFQEEDGVAVAYLYCNFRRENEQRPHDLLASLLKQLACGRPLPPALWALYESNKRTRMRLSLDQIRRLFTAVLSTVSKAFIVIDALDECQAAYGHRARFLSEVLALRAAHKINIFATSRFIPEIVDTFNQAVSLEIRAASQDIGMYIEGRMQEMPAFVQRNSQLQEEIRAKVSDAADGVFLLARLYLSALKDKLTPKAVRNALDQFDQQSGGGSDDKTGLLELAYSDAMERIQGQGPGRKRLAKEVLAWITCSRRPLTTDELQHALAIEVGQPALDRDNIPEVGDMVSVCCGLVAVDDESGIIRLVHFTTQQYLNQTRLLWFPDAQGHIASACVTYLSFDDFSEGICLTDSDYENRLNQHRFYEYAARNWGYHVHNQSSLSYRAVLEFLKRQSHIKAASQAMLVDTQYKGHEGYSQQITQGVTGAHLIAAFGIEGVARLALSDGNFEFWAQPDSLGMTPLAWAVSGGQAAIVKLLTDTGRIDADYRDQEGRTPMSWAAVRGYRDIVDILLATGKVNPDSKATGEYNRGRSPLSFAAGIGHAGVAKRLLEVDGVDADSVDGNGWTPLSWAAGHGFNRIVNLILEQKVNINSRDKTGRTSLNWAAASGHADVVSTLLATGQAEVNAADADGRTPLSWAAGNGQQEAAALLLDDKLVDVNLSDKNKWTPLSWAAGNGFAAVTKLLLGTGLVNVDLQDVGGRTPLSWASEKGYGEVVDLLLELGGADPDVKDWGGWTPLCWAAGAGCDKVVTRLLATNKVDVNSRDTKGATPLWWAKQNGRDSTVELLMAASSPEGTKADPALTDEPGWTTVEPEHHAGETAKNS